MKTTRTMLGALLVSMLASCQSDALTELVVQVEARDFALERGTLVIDGAAIGHARVEREIDASMLPASLTVIHGGGPLGPVHLELSGVDADGGRVTTSAQVDFIMGRSLVVPLVLSPSCAAVQCAGNETCRAGVCEPLVMVDAGMGMMDAGATDMEMPDAGPMDMAVADTGFDAGNDMCAPLCSGDCECDPACESCTLSCTEGSDCSPECKDEDCSIVARRASTADMKCDGNARCEISGETDAVIDVHCKGRSTCVVDCSNTRECLVRCDRNATCEITGCGERDSCGYERCDARERKCAETHYCGENAEEMCRETDD